MKIGNPVKENTIKSVECIASTTNLASSLGMEFYIDGSKKIYDTPFERTGINGSHNGMVETFAFTFTTDRSMDGKIAKCSLHWKMTQIQAAEDKLNITCE